MNGENRFPLSESIIEFIREMRQQMRDLDQRVNGVLQFFCKEHNIKGNVRLSDDGTELILEQVDSGKEVG
jgi:hypothetical protein